MRQSLTQFTDLPTWLRCSLNTQETNNLLAFASELTDSYLLGRHVVEGTWLQEEGTGCLMNMHQNMQFVLLIPRLGLVISPGFRSLTKKRRKKKCFPPVLASVSELRLTCKQNTDCNDCSPFAHPKVLPDTALQAIISSAGALERCSSVFGALDLKFRLSRINIGMKEVIQHGMGNNKHISAPIHQPLIAAHMRCLPK